MVTKKGSPVKKPQAKTPVFSAKSKWASDSSIDFVFDKQNYFWLLIGLAFILLGFILMIGGGSENPDVWNPAIFNFRRITLAPILVMIGYGIEVYAILRKSKDSDNEAKESKE
jgi:hypothetical protein